MHVMNSEEKVIKNEAWLISSLPWPLEGGSGVATYMYGRSTSASSKSSCCLALLGLHSHCAERFARESVLWAKSDQALASL